MAASKPVHDRQRAARRRGLIPIWTGSAIAFGATVAAIIAGKFGIQQKDPKIEPTCIWKGT